MLLSCMDGWSEKGSSKEGATEVDHIQNTKSKRKQCGKSSRSAEYNSEFESILEDKNKFDMDDLKPAHKPDQVDKCKIGSAYLDLIFY